MRYRSQKSEILKSEMWDYYSEMWDYNPEMWDYNSEKWDIEVRNVRL